MGKIIGLDIGIASVGWAVVDDEYNIIEAGSNIFPAADASKNEERRSFRQGRRLKRREKTRISDFKKLWEKYGLPIPEKNEHKILELRLRGLEDKLELEEIYQVLLNNLKHRGISYLEDAIEEGSSDSSEYKKGLEINQKELENKLPCEIQKERLDKYGCYRGTITVDNDGEKIVFNNIFTVASYRKEITKFLDTQRKFYMVISDEFIDEYIRIFNRKREYYEGPGNEKSRTDYGRYTTKRDEVTGEFITEENIFEKLIGKCSVYKEEKRASGASYTAQEFNVLNDLNNLLVNGRKLEKEEKIAIIAAIKTEKTVNMKKIIQKAIGENIESFAGARIDKNEKEIFHKFEAYNAIRKSLEKIGQSIDMFSMDELDILGDILTLNTEKAAIVNAITKSPISCSDEVIDVLVDVRKKNGTLFSKWQSLSIKIMRELIPALYEESKNQMQLLTEMGVFRTREDKFNETTYIPVDVALEDIYNPVVRRSIRVTINIVNALLKKYGEFDKIVIEMPRDRNTEEQKKRIKDTQKNNEKELKEILDKIQSSYGIKITKEDFYHHKKLVMKLKLWNEQDGRCPYSGKKIDIDTILNDRDMLEIDHIIPISISFDDSRSNKVLVYRHENQLKGNQTPYMYLSSVNREWGLQEYITYIKDLKNKKNISYNKLKNFLFDQDINKIDVVKGFINRNLNDTSYTSRVVLNTMQGFFGAHGKTTKVKVIRGSFTHQMRVNMGIEKDRDDSYSHHAVDAMLIAFSQLGYDAFYKLQKEFIDFETGEILDYDGWKNAMSEEVYKDYMYEDKWQKIKQDIVAAQMRVKYWYKVDKKCNRALCNQTIRGTRIYEDKVYKINKLNIYSDDGIKTFRNKISKGKEDNFLMYINDPKSFEQLMLIYNEYRDARNPFVQYEKETGDYIRKYSKNHNGPRIATLKYTDGEIGSCIDISHKYGHERGSKRVVLESLKPYRADIYKNVNDNQYYIVGVKYSDICCKNGQYIIDENKYTEILLNEKMIKEGQDRGSLESLGFQFLFSLYKNDIIEYEKDGEIERERFLSRTKPKQRNYIETKPIDAPKFDKQKLVGLGKTTCIRKVVTDILGSCYYVQNEKFKSRVDI